MTYWPIGKTRDNAGNDLVLCTYDGCKTQNEACNQFDIWENEYDYELWDMKIHVYDDSKRLINIFDIERGYLVKGVNKVTKDTSPQPKQSL